MFTVAGNLKQEVVDAHPEARVNLTPLSDGGERAPTPPRMEATMEHWSALDAARKREAALVAEVNALRSQVVALEGSARREAYWRERAQGLEAALAVVAAGVLPEDVATEAMCSEDEGLNKYVATRVERARPTKIWDLYQNMVQSNWTAEEVDLAEDKREWATAYDPRKKKGLSAGEKHFVLHIIAFFLSSEGAVIENAAKNLLTMVQWGDFRQFYSYQIGNEAIHAQTYSEMAEVLCEDAEERLRVFNAVETMPAVAAKADWARRWLQGEEVAFEPTPAWAPPQAASPGLVVHKPPRLAQALVAFAAVEGIFFSGSFCALFWLKKRGKMPGLTFANELISRDEGVHLLAAGEAYAQLDAPLPREEALEIICSAVEGEKQFVCGALDVDVIGMNAVLMGQYIEFVADFVLGVLGYAAHYGTANPFEWMDLISMDGKTNFFEKRVGEYAKAHAHTVRDTTDAGAGASNFAVFADDF